ncbi:MAG: hypothetical protein U0T85_02550 [Cloacibacterium normanense]
MAKIQKYLQINLKKNAMKTTFSAEIESNKIARKYFDIVDETTNTEEKQKLAVVLFVKILTNLIKSHL